mmetsp:Transcript_16252/g.18402  ORF Transcript_16252/g.18402 Transcript_16252/m.18402 type:complete len:392 (+) Transcript_16252:44-1219(+)
MGETTLGNRMIVLWKSQAIREADIKLRFQNIVESEVKNGSSVNQAAAIALETLKGLMQDSLKSLKRIAKGQKQASTVKESSKPSAKTDIVMEGKCLNKFDEPAGTDVMPVAKKEESLRRSHSANMDSTPDGKPSLSSDRKERKDKPEITGEKEQVSNESKKGRQLLNGNEKHEKTEVIEESENEKHTKPEVIEECGDTSSTSISSQLKAIRRERAKHFITAKQNEDNAWTDGLLIGSDSEKKKKKSRKKKKTKPRSRGQVAIQKVSSKDPLGEEDDEMAFLDSMVAAQTRCSLSICNSSNRLGETCPFCKLKYCLKHRLPEDHGCRSEAKSEARKNLIIGGNIQGRVVRSQRNSLKKKLGQKLNDHASSRTGKDAEKAKTKANAKKKKGRK